MPQLQKSLAEIEEGISEIACAQGALEFVSGALDQSVSGAESGIYLDLLHIISCFLDSALHSLDRAAGEARAAEQATAG